jgi:ABC-type oligopeptide transport system substrate-binding subunit
MQEEDHLTRHRRLLALLALLLGFSMIAAACGDDDGGDSAAGSATDDGTTTDGTDDGTDSAAPTQAGGELIDGGTFVGDPPEHIDPALNVTLDAYQVVNALFDGLTEFDFSDPENPQVVPLVAEEYESNEEATEWTFTIREGAQFSDGEPITAQTFLDSWERASDPKFAGDYSYLFSFIKGGAEKLEGKADTLEGVTVDEAANTLTVELSAPYSNFPAVAGFQLFFPVHPDAIADPEAYENGLMIGNGPYMLSEPRSDEEIIVEKNENWQGDFNGETWDDRLDSITFLTSADPDTAYNALEAGETDTANIPPGRVTEADENYGTTLDVANLGSYHFEIKANDPVVGGPENVDLRKAISMAIDRDEINAAVYEGTRTTSTGVTPPGIPGQEMGLCEYCAYDPAAAEEAFQAWTDAGNELTEPLRIQFNADAGHEDVIAIMIDNLSQIGIEAEPEPFPSETYFTELAEGACQICRSGWYADYPTYDNFMYDLFHSDAIGGNNHGEYSNPEFDELVDEAKQTVDPEEQGQLFRDAENILLNEDVQVIPVNWYRGDYVFDDTKIANFPQNNLGLILWEQVALAA